MNKKLKLSLIKPARSLLNSSPLIFGTIMLIGIVNSLIPKQFYGKIFTKNIFIDSFIGSLVGGISAGNPITSYIFGGEILKQGVGIVAVTAFIVSWITVGVIQIPAESMILGKKFAIWRNVTAFVLSIVVAIITILILEAI